MHALMDPVQPYAAGNPEQQPVQEAAPQAEMPHVEEKPKLHDTIALSALLSVILIVILSFAFFFWYLNMQGSQIAGLKPNVTVNDNAAASTTQQKQLSSSDVSKPTSSLSAKSQLDKLDSVMSNNANAEASDYSTFSSDLNNGSTDTSEFNESEQL